MSVVQLHRLVPIVDRGRPTSHVVPGHSAGGTFGLVDHLALRGRQAKRWPLAAFLAAEVVEVVVPLKGAAEIVTNSKGELRPQIGLIGTRNVVGDEVDDQPDAPLVEAGEHPVEVVQ